MGHCHNGVSSHDHHSAARFTGIRPHRCVAGSTRRSIACGLELRSVIVFMVQHETIHDHIGRWISVTLLLKQKPDDLKCGLQQRKIPTTSECKVSNGSLVILCIARKSFLGPWSNTLPSASVHDYYLLSVSLIYSYADFRNLVYSAPEDAGGFYETLSAYKALNQLSFSSLVQEPLRELPQV
jgi:hypothetical protein